ncbi:hypothetical protein PYW07_006338 [Mythimna separata]|uniref:Ig-like domain-containing protein n=1 Tax=Mythimna separata TaxID=271217 RepID=A0AAD8DWF8_MYTSE|nr:hypothetical protein PYW07_006338 [Mythimna separata]
MWGRIYPLAALLILAHIILKASCTGSSSLTFVIDDTYSMTDDIDQVKRSVDRISDIVFNEKASQIGNMVLVAFNDPDATVKTVTTDRQTFKRTVDALFTYNYGQNVDCWEPSMKGLRLGLETSNRDSYIYVFTDASAKDYLDSHYVKELCQKKQSQIVFVLTGRCGNYYAAASFDVYFDIAQACSGQAFDVERNQVEEVLRTIEETIKGKKTVLTTTVVPANVYKDIPFTIDDHTDYAIVSVSGKNVYLDIKGPSFNLEKIMWNNNGKVAKLNNVKPGKYVAKVMGHTRTSVVIVGRTDFLFSHGFSELKPKSLGDTSLQPIANSNVHLSISVTDDHHSVQIVSAQILNMDENPIGSPLPLTETSKDFYVTNAFVAPSQRFKIAVNGIVKSTGKPIKRIGKIPITPQEPPNLPVNTKPTVEIAEGKSTEVEYNSTTSLTCKVEAYPKPTIAWVNLRGRVMPSKMSTVELPYKYISYMDLSYAEKGDRYKCYATNDVGRDEKTINVVVKEPFTIKSVPSGITKLIYDKEGFLKCDVTSHLPIDIHWFYANEITGQTKEILTSDKYEVTDSGTRLKIKKMDLDLEGRYSCKVSLKNKKDKQKSFPTRVKVDGLIAPKVKVESPVKVVRGKTAVIECKVESGVPAPNITWYFGGKLSSMFTPISSERVLRITNVDDKHEGKYKCAAENLVGKNEQVTTLMVQDLPKITTTNAMVYQAIEGDAVLRIPCVAAGIPKPEIIWKLSGRSITPSAKYFIENGTLIIRAPTVSDTNSYTCEAKNEAGTYSSTFKTYIRQAPIVSGVATKKILIGSPATVECKVKGEPKPTITWQYKDKTGSNFLSIPGTNQVLSIARVELKHAGHYKCVAQNDVGKNEHITEVEVQEMPKIITSTSTTYQGIEGDTLLKIPCVATGLPKPTITWKLNGRVINPSGKYSIQDGALIIREVKMSDTNSYTCEAKNEVGAVSATFKTYIRQRPKLSGVATKNVRLGNPTFIECTIVKGEPQPKISWQFTNKTTSKFVPIAGSETTLRFGKAEKKHAGMYKCVAQNNVGVDEHVTTLIVEYAASITSNSSKIEGIVGDLAMRIPCDVIGVPKPVITWKLKGVTITPSAKYSIEDGALVIMKPTETDTSSYTCEAKNHISSVSVTLQARVDKFPVSPGTVHHIYIKEGETRKLKCDGYNSTSQLVKWFTTTKTADPSTSKRPESSTAAPSKFVSSTTLRTITKDEGNKENIQIASASSDHDGNYTCHVSDKHGNTQTHTYVVDVGMPPKFTDPDNSITNWRGDIVDITQNCEIEENAKPTPVIQWTFNGKVLTDPSSVGVGHYTCNASNAHGFVLKRFDVTTSACLLTRTSRDTPNTPLVLNEEKSWHKFETTKHYTIVEQEEKIVLSCPSQKGTFNTFKSFPKKSTLEARCYKEDSFLVEGKIHKLSDLQCTNSIQPSVIKKKAKCLTDTSELMSVGYNVPEFLEAYEVCFDHKSNMPLYTRILMTDTNNNGVSNGYNWYTNPGIGSKQTERGFTCKDASSSCCYSKSQLVNAVDFNDGPAKKSTFLDPLNVIPAWMPCDTSKSSWEDINEMVRSQLPVYMDIVVWSGTHTLQKKNGAVIPRYLWKVVRLDYEDVFAIVHVNDPNPTKSDIKCKSPAQCDKYEDWLMTDDSTYCCSLPDFLKSFDIHSTDIGESMDAVLDKIDKV